MINGMIIMWSKPIAQIPNGWALCDGTNGTPDLRDRFIVGAAAGQDPGATGGANFHQHDFTADGHYHNIGVGAMISSGPGYLPQTDSKNVTGTTGNADGRPPFYALVFIMKL